MAKTDSKLTIFYDGLCPLCSREIDHYRKQSGAEKFQFTDITDPKFKAESEGLDPVQVHKVMHVRAKDGTLKTGVEAFIEIWKNLPRYKTVASLAENRLVRPFLNIGYFCFAKVRPYLPRKNRDCEDSPYCDVRK